MRAIKNIFSHFYMYVIWLILSYFLWGWIFGMVNDTTTYHKISIYIDCASLEEMDLTLELEEDMPEGIKKVKVHSFDYVVFDDATMLMGDIFIIRESDLEGYLEVLQPITELAAQGWPEYETYDVEGEAYGIKIFDGETGEGILQDYVTWLKPGEDAQDFYLVFLADSVHLGDLNGSDDEAAFEMAERLLGMQ
ncbi:MAG: hypothetical protein LUE29_01470 [Lachnospiraceae bacterium]|nr:hypothetical protein [Lachnospiraceae bacterium]